MRKSKVLSFVLVAALAVTAIPINAFGTVSDEKNKLSDLQNQKQQAQDENNKLQKSKSDAQEYIQSVDKKLTNLAIEMYKTNQKLSKTEDKISKTQKELDNAQVSINEQYEDMKLRIKYMYENGNTKFVDILCQSKDISEFLNNAEYISTISSYDREQLVAYQQIRKKVQEQQTALEEEYAKLEDLQNDLIAKQMNVESLKASKESEISSISGELEQTNQKLAELQAAAEEAARKQKEKEAAAAAAKKNNNSGSAGGAVVSGNGMFTHPCPGYSRISSTFGYRNAPLAGASTNHKGVDFAASTGTPIYAAAAGTVTSAGYSGKAGNLIIINHGNGLLTYYMHCNTIFVSAGQKVSKGQNIGQVGTTGNSTGPHLHFQVMNNGTPVNPMNYL